MTDLAYHTGHPTKRIKTEEVSVLQMQCVQVSDHILTKIYPHQERLSNYYPQPGNSYMPHRFSGGPGRQEDKENHVLLVR